MMMFASDITYSSSLLSSLPSSEEEVSSSGCSSYSSFSNTPVMRVSHDNGETNGIIGGEEEG
jgi:hypothetical protein